jgi:hypothetical protein
MTCFDTCSLKNALTLFGDQVSNPANIVPFVQRISNTIVTEDMAQEAGVQQTVLANVLQDYCIVNYYGKRALEGEEFSQKQKLWLVGYVFFRDNIADEDYPFNFVEGQVKELALHSEQKFINNVFASNIQEFINEYKQSFGHEPSKDSQLEWANPQAD